MKRILSALSIAALALGTLTACDPPIPASLLVEEAERTVTCTDSPLELASAGLLQDSVAQINGTLVGSCPNMEIQINDVPAGSSWLSLAANEQCEAILNVPLAIDAAALTFYYGENYELAFSAETVFGILTGAIVSWDDPAIVAENPYATLGPDPIKLSAGAPVQSILAMERWLSEKLGEQIDLPIEESSSSEVDEIYALEDGSLRLSSYGNVIYSGYGIVSFLTEAGNPESAQVWDKLQLDSAGTQFEWEETEAGISVSYNSSIEPQPLAGFSDITAPAPTAFTINLTLCGEDGPVVRSYARYLLRLDSQGQINAGVLSPLPEDLRVAAALLVEPLKSE
jgi:hypothetical protein